MCSLYNTVCLAMCVEHCRIAEHFRPDSVRCRPPLGQARPECGLGSTKLCVGSAEQRDRWLTRARWGRPIWCSARPNAWLVTAKSGLASSESTRDSAKFRLGTRLGPRLGQHWFVKKSPRGKFSTDRPNGVVVVQLVHIGSKKYPNVTSKHRCSECAAQRRVNLILC